MKSALIRIFVTVPLALVFSVGAQEASGVKTIALTRPTVAVFPLQDLDQTSDSQHWGYTFAVLLDNYLRPVKTVHLLQVESVVGEYVATNHGLLQNEDYQKAGRTLELQQVVWGTYKHNGTGWDLHVKMMDVASGKSGKLLDLASTSWLTAPAECAEAVLSQLKITLSNLEKQKLSVRPTESLEALELWSRSYELDTKGMFAEAATNLEMAVTIDPKFTLGMETLVPSLAESGRTNEALKWAMRATELQPDDEVAHRTEALLYFHTGSLTLASKEFSLASKLDPDDPINYTDLGSIQANQGDLEGAASTLEMAEKVAPYDATIRARLGRAYVGLNNPTHALAELSAAERLDNGQWDDKSVVAESYALLGDQRSAVKWYEKYLDGAKQAGQAPDRIEAARIALEEAKARLTPQFVTAVPPQDFTENDLENALKAKLSPDECKLVVNPLASTPEMDKRAESLVGNIHDQMGIAKRLFDEIARPHAFDFTVSTKTAVDVFKDWSNPKAPFVCQDYALFYVALARHLGLKAYVVLIDKDYRGAYVAHACAGIFIDRKALLIDPTYQWFGVPHKGYEFENDLRVTTLLLCDSSEKCVIGSKLSPDWAYAQFLVAATLANQGVMRQAIQTLQTGLKLDSESPFALYTEGVVEIDKYDYADAVLHLQRALNLEPENSSTRWTLAKAYYNQGKMKEAREQFQIYLQGTTLYPLNEAAARNAIEEIDGKLGRP